MPKGIYDRSSVKVIRDPEEFPPLRKCKCICGNCRICRQRMWRASKRQQKPHNMPINERAMDEEPLFDDLTFKLIERFKERGWD
jgi:hypothetical protein